ncbi:PREDICTED: protein DETOXIFICATION 8-like [Nelumbo nucifera]|uniref:Protein DETOXIFICATION 8-like n=1 Tax=Nelumbo nucifera TaxID=4432 RepID=A0A1U7ZJD7_NELNU|nr:PREDICTED: protein DETOXIFICATION 8-like [Nelumbo nucifera]
MEEEGLLVKENKERREEVLRWDDIVEEVKRVGYMAGLMIAVTVSQYLLQVISVVMVGHLGEISLSSVAIATSLTGVTGFSLLVSLFTTLLAFHRPGVRSIASTLAHQHFKGVARGCGWQHIGAYVNLGAFYLVGIPIASVLGFCTHLRGKGLWIGIVTGSTSQSVLLSLITIFTNWQKQTDKARGRIFEEGLLIN